MRKSVPFDCRRAALGLAMFAGLVTIPTSPASAQLPATRLFAAFPPGGQVGTTVDLTITSGQELEEIQRLIFNHPGITAVPKMQDVAGKPQPVANQFVVTIAANVPADNYELAAVGFFGISNPRTFVVGARKELIETEPNNTKETAFAVELNQIINGRINGATDVDWFKFTGKSGQRVLVDCVARRLDSKLDGHMELFDAGGRRISQARNSNVSRDALLDVTLASDGEYFLKLRDFVNAGGEDYPYRLNMTIGPYIDFVMPPAGTPGSNGQFTLYGRNLPGGQPANVTVRGRPLEKLTVSIPLPAAADTLDPRTTMGPFSAGMDAVPFSIDSPNGRSNPVMIFLSGAAPVLEVEPNNLGTQSQKIAVPGEIAAQFQERGDIDCFTFDAKAKDTFWVEVVAHRAGSAADPVVVIDQVKTNEKGEEALTRISALDDDPTNPLPNLFDTLNDDSSIRFVAPSDGTFRITLRNRYGSAGDASLVYRLILRPETPDFRVVAIPSALTAPAQRQGAPSGITLRRGDNFPIYVAALRRDGFTGPVTVSAEGLPAGVTCPEVTLGTTPSSGIMVFTSTADAPPFAGAIKLVAKARIEAPTDVQALVDAQGAAKAAVDALAAADKALAKPADDLAKANEALTAAKTELAAKTDDEGLKKKVADSEAKVTATAAAHKTAADARAAADVKVRETQAAVQKAEAARNASAKDVVHAARYGTILWNAPQPNQPSEARIAQSILLSVIEETAPIQLTTTVHRFEANHNRQILVPVTIARRNGFDQPLNLTFVGQPQNSQVENKAIAKEKTEELFRVFIPPNAPVGTYVMFLAGQSPVSYRKNPAKADRLKTEFTAAEQAATAAVEALKNATTAKDAAIKKATDDAANLKKLTEAKQAADKALADAQATEKAAAEALKNAGDNAEAKAAAEKKLVEVQAMVKAATDAQTAAEKARIDAEAAAKQADEAKAKSEAEAKAADDKNKAAIAEKAAADQRFKAADTFAKAANIPFNPHTTPIIVTVKAAPYTVTASPADGGNVKQGAKIEVKCEVKRQNGFVGPVTLTLPLPPNVAGVKAEPVTILADQSAGTLVVEAAADAPEAQLANMVVRAVAQWEGEAAVDQPVTLKVIK